MKQLRDMYPTSDSGAGEEVPVCSVSLLWVLYHMLPSSGSETDTRPLLS